MYRPDAQVDRIRLFTAFLCSVLVSTFIACHGGGISGVTKVTKANYASIKEGMSYARVVTIIGSEGEEIASN